MGDSGKWRRVATFGDLIPQDAPMDDHPLHHLRHAMDAHRRALAKLRVTLETLMSDNDDISSTEDAVNAAVDAYIADRAAAVAGLTKTVADLTAQLAAGPPGLTDAQAKVAISRLNDMIAKLKLPVPAPAA